MEAAATPRTGPRWPAILLAIVLVLVAIFFLAVAVTLVGDDLCADVQFGQECVDKSSGNRIATVVAGALAGLAALWGVVVCFGIARGRRAWSAIGVPLAATVIFAAITIVL
jgi:hypothetical protein